MHWQSMFETVTPGISGHTAQAEPTAAAIAKRFSAIIQTGHLPASRGPARLIGFRKGLRDSGFIEGQNVAMIE